MYSIGVDLHKENLVLEVLDSLGLTVERKTFATRCKERIRDYFSSYGLHCQVAFESVGFYHWFWDLLKPVVGKLYLADPAGVRLYAGRKAKTDRNDAHLIAQLLHEGRLPAAYVPDEPVASLRKIERHRNSVSRMLSRSKNALRWISLRTNLPGPAQLTAANAQKWVLAQDQKFSETDRKSARLNLDLIRELEYSVTDMDREIGEYIAKFPELKHRNELLQTIPGIGPVAAATIIAETGDITRFTDAGQLCSYAGLSPRVSQSGETVRHGHISKQGPPILRWVLQQSAWVAIRCSPEARHIYNRIARKAGRKKAATALARKLLVYAWSVCRRDQPFRWEIKIASKHMGKEEEKGVWCFQI